MNTYDQFTDVCMAAMNLAISRLYHERFPEQPHGGDDVELAEENLFEKCKILVEQDEEEVRSNQVADLKKVLSDMASLPVGTVDDKTTAAKLNAILPPFKQDLLMTDEEVLDLVHGSPFPVDPPLVKNGQYADLPRFPVNEIGGFPKNWKPLSERTEEAIADSRAGRAQQQEPIRVEKQDPFTAELNRLHHDGDDCTKDLEPNDRGNREG
jgi:hypothetical protein